MATVLLYGQAIEQQRQRKNTGAGVTLAIANGTATSDVADKRGFGSVGIIFPALTSCTMKIQVSDSATGTFADLYNAAGTQIITATTSGSFAWDVPELAAFNFFRLVSSVNQGAVSITIQAHV